MVLITIAYRKHALKSTSFKNSAERPIRGRELWRSLRYDRESVYRAHVAFVQEQCKVHRNTPSIKMKRERNPPAVNCGQNHTANYGGCLAAPKPRHRQRHKRSNINNIRIRSSQPKATPKVMITPAKGTKTIAGGDDFRLAPIPSVNPWNRKK
ncbi:hypothetical protein EVAR_27665_1 [Eumeta japonica]|uniref:Uncharacterized protein n=1 Tax=Eumeta variegata TaxID=151549 RepID=A0A4C1V0H7_EUMVA|nr:hypothetical protein EVAR_27665_1 [Eumeta japonica]